VQKYLTKGCPYCATLILLYNICKKKNHVFYLISRNKNAPLSCDGMVRYSPNRITKRCIKHNNNNHMLYFTLCSSMHKPALKQSMILSSLERL
jgi:hypothetical protein